MPNPQKSLTGRIGLFSTLTPALLIIIALVQTYARTEKVRESAIYSHGVLRVAIPYSATQSGSGKLKIEVLDPEDHAIGQVERPAEAIKGASQFKAELKLDKPLPVEDLV
jgi:hypothetical protein